MENRKASLVKENSLGFEDGLVSRNKGEKWGLKTTLNNLESDIEKTGVKERLDFKSKTCHLAQLENSLSCLASWQ